MVFILIVSGGLERISEVKRRRKQAGYICQIVSTLVKKLVWGLNIYSCRLGDMPDVSATKIHVDCVRRSMFY